MGNNWVFPEEKESGRVVEMCYLKWILIDTRGLQRREGATRKELFQIDHTYANTVLLLPFLSFLSLFICTLYVFFLLFKIFWLFSFNKFDYYMPWYTFAHIFVLFLGLLCFQDPVAYSCHQICNVFGNYVFNYLSSPYSSSWRFQLHLCWSA